MSMRKLALMGAAGAGFAVLALLVALRPAPAFAAVEPATGAPPRPSPGIIAPDCPVSSDQLGTSGGLAICVDRGEGSTYTEGDQITVCASANIPQPAIYPPPPAPTIRVESIVGDTTRRLLEAQFAQGNRCLTGTIAAPFGQEAVRVQALRPDETAFLTDTVEFATRPR
jgi:hypothetical protein